jgi:hypothetical protein
MMKMDMNKLFILWLAEQVLAIVKDEHNVAVEALHIAKKNIK